MATTIVTTEVLAVTREYYRVPVELKVNGAVVDPTGLPLECALTVTQTAPVDADWKAGSWETTLDDFLNTLYLARAFVGVAPADFSIAVGTTYDVYMRITDNPERPARLVGRIKGV